MIYSATPGYFISICISKAGSAHNLYEVVTHTMHVPTKRIINSMVILVIKSVYIFMRIYNEFVR